MHSHFNLGLFVISLGLFVLVVALLPVFLIIGGFVAWKLRHRIPWLNSRHPGVGCANFRFGRWRDNDDLVSLRPAKSEIRTPDPGLSHEPGFSHPGRVLRELVWFGPPVVVAMTFAGIAMQYRPISGMIPQQTDVPPKPSASSSATSGSVQQIAAKDKTVDRPDWVGTSRTTDGISERVVLTSGQFTTVAEAEAELLPKASELIHQDLKRVNSMGDWAETWRPDNRDVKRNAVKKVYVEATETDFVSFQHPMYQVWWQVELSPAVRAEFLPSWRREAISIRIWWIGIVASSLALAASMIRVYCRMDSLTEGKHRLALKGLNCGIIAAWAFLIRSVSDGRLW